MNPPKQPPIWPDGRIADILALEEWPGPALRNGTAEAWRPRRGVAAGLVWSYYGSRTQPPSHDRLLLHPDYRQGG